MSVDAMTVVRLALLAADGAALSAKAMAETAAGGGALEAVRTAVARGVRSGALVRHHNPDGVLRYTLAPQRGKGANPKLPLTERVDAAIVSGQYDTRDVMVAVGGDCAISEVAQALRRLEKRGAVEREVVDNITLWRRAGTPAKGPSAQVAGDLVHNPFLPLAKGREERAMDAAKRSDTLLPATAKIVADNNKPFTSSADPFGLTSRLAVVTEDAENLVHDALASTMPDTVAQHLALAAFELGRAHRALLTLSQTQGAQA